MATLEERLNSLAVGIAADYKALNLAKGDLGSLSTTAKGNLVAAINEVMSLASTGTQLINDSAGDGVVNKTWSADKIGDTILGAITSLRNELTGGGAAALDTFAELAAAISNDATFAQTLATSMSKKVSVEAQTFSLAEKLQARENIGAVAVADVGDTNVDLLSIYNTAKQ
jgi:hypothetical protein